MIRFCVLHFLICVLFHKQGRVVAEATAHHYRMWAIFIVHMNIKYINLFKQMFNESCVCLYIPWLQPFES